MSDTAGRIYPEPASLLVIDVATGERRVVLGLDALSALLPGDGGEVVLRSLNRAFVAPAGDRIALWLRAAPVAPRAGPPLSDLVVVDTTGHLLWRETLPVGDYLHELAWSPDGARLAYAFDQVGTILRVVDLAAGTDFSMPLAPFLEEQALAWSPDGRLLALAHYGRLDLVAGTPPPRAWLLGAGGASPSWRPGTGR